ncbi:hypothetical protein [Oryzifoliimicrobium ureilyticus]|uniref:hypothetical protein n=1 Tax=Oryzifoliimicrobium ureilyticus TaxID=3113724 RepID=UPI0030766B32
MAESRETKENKGSTPSQVRGDIQAGHTADIRAGFDPALAPMETDAEAAGSPMSSEQADIARETQATARQDREKNFDVAMQEPVTNRTESQTGRVGYLFVVTPVLALIALGLAFLTWLYPR